MENEEKQDIFRHSQKAEQSGPHMQIDFIIKNTKLCHLTTPMASSANNTVPKNMGNSDNVAAGRFPSKVNGSRKT